MRTCPLKVQCVTWWWGCRLQAAEYPSAHFFLAKRVREPTVAFDKDEQEVLVVATEPVISQEHDGLCSPPGQHRVEQ